MALKRLLLIIDLDMYHLTLLIIYILSTLDETYK